MSSISSRASMLVSQRLHLTVFLKVTLIVLLFAASIGGTWSIAAEDSMELALEVQGTITPRCEISMSRNSVDPILTDNAGSAELPFSLDCNQFLSVEMQSLNGGLLHDSSSLLIPSPGFTDFLPYDLNFSFTGSGAQQTLAFNSEEIKGIPLTRNSGSIPFQTNGMLRFNWVPEASLFGGRYSDTVEIRVSGF